jgi:hypothetical protein
MPKTGDLLYEGVSNVYFLCVDKMKLVQTVPQKVQIPFNVWRPFWDDGRLVKAIDLGVDNG